jgi:hypothetical protein
MSKLAVETQAVGERKEAPFPWGAWTVATAGGALFGGLLGVVFIRLIGAATTFGWNGAVPFAAGPALLLAAAGAGLAQASMLRHRLAKPLRWAVATAIGGSVGMVWSVALLFGGDWLVDKLTGASGFVTLPIWLALGPLGALPLAMLQQRVLGPAGHARGWVRVVLLSGVLAAPAAIVAAGIASQTLYALLNPFQHRDPSMIGLEFDLAVPVGLAIGWAVAAAPWGLRLRRVL